jgi:molybdate transport system substrate-binding protein
VNGEPFDLTILGEGAIDDLIRQGRLAGATRAVVARSALGVAILKGARKPDISTADAFKRTMLDAKSVAYLEDGLTGSYMWALFRRLGIIDDIRSKYKSARGAEAVIRGEVELGITQVSEILFQTGTDLVGPLPPEIQHHTNFPAALSASAREPAGAKALLDYLRSPEVAQVLRSRGLEPGA